VKISYKIKSTITVLAISCICILGFTSCNGLFNVDTDKVKTSSLTANSSDTVEVSFSFSLPDDLSSLYNTESDDSNTSLRSVTATLPTLLYDITATAPGLDPISYEDQASSCRFSLTPGITWTITVTAHQRHGTDIILKGEKTITVSVACSEIIPLSVNTDGTTGTIDIPLAVSSSFDSYSYSFTNNTTSDYYSGTTATGTGEILAGTGDTKVSLSSDNTISAETVKPGTYGLLILFYKSNSLVYTLSTSITVYPTLTTNTWALETGASSGTFTLTSTMVSNYENTVYFVGDTSITGAVTAADTNNGSAYAPLKTVAAAVAKCKTIGNSYTVYVNSTTTETSSIVLTTGTTVNIKPFTGTPTIARASTQTSSMISVPSGATLNMTSITLDGKATTCASTVDGGGINSSGTLSLTSCTITNCYAATGSSKNGGGIYVTSGSITLDGCSITKCSGNSGGGIYTSGTSVTLKGTTTIDCCRSNYGAGIYIASGNCTLEGSVIIGNTSGYSYSTGDTFPTSGNLSGASGGGICKAGSGTLSITGSNVKIYGNKGASGGGVYLNGGTFTMELGTIESNTVTSNGGGVYVASGSFTMSGSSTISDNKATGNGGGVYVYSTFTMSGGTISSNTATYGAGVYIYNGSFTMSDGSITSNTATSNGAGVYINGTFNIQGSAVVDQGNAVYLVEGYSITPSDITNSKIAKIVPASNIGDGYSILPNGNYFDRFNVVKYESGKEWILTSEGKLQCQVYNLSLQVTSFSNSIDDSSNEIEMEFKLNVTHNGSTSLLAQDNDKLDVNVNTNNVSGGDQVNCPSVSLTQWLPAFNIGFSTEYIYEYDSDSANDNFVFESASNYTKSDGSTIDLAFYDSGDSTERFIFHISATYSKTYTAFISCISS
jgi:parallel beta-helix repeat protein